ncbi:hypothetical protein GMORB2_1551 [Geosmithia morbida]|uniref:DUF155 domain-containing protein n=1 Tax=Geosmithia morbida TaxID=1094350 RepID=A0A9P5D0K6_9HYPO|nr:uncharacterized protein GMORB2_1551 [Geosmithia morbida]KAF4121712.1 hypothetical protein GMORB2_1551 [Geosmithia morbida]
MTPSKRGPSVLVTDARERQDARRPSSRPGSSQGQPRSPMRFMTVDNVLQFNTQIPSGQPRMPPLPAARQPASSGSGSSRPAPVRRVMSSGGGGGGGIANTQSRTGRPMPSRTSKISEKLVLLPDTADKDDDDDEVLADEESRCEELARRGLLDDNAGGPLKDEELEVLRMRGGVRGKSYAERLPKRQRADKVSRLTAYCMAQAFKMKATAAFLRDHHGAKTKLYDDCLYVIYSLPLLNGMDGCRVRSRPILKTPGTGKTVLDLEIERSEWRDHHEGYFEDDAYTKDTAAANHSPFEEEEDMSSSHPERHQHGQHQQQDQSQQQQQQHQHQHQQRRHNKEQQQHYRDTEAAHLNRLAPDTKNLGEIFVFSYGVVVFWNFSENQEKDILADLTFADAEKDGASLLTRPLEQDDYETEEFHFEYSSDVQRPRVFNDMFTLMPRSDHMIKLTISHAIAQSTRLCFFEERMSETMLDAQHVPKNLALTGELNMTRTEIVRILGRLFKSRVDINLSSNVLDVPNFFWDSEPTLHPLYAAIRDYLEIDPRIKVLNERCRVFLDLAEILSDSIADSKMSAITWIVIILIVVSILVTVTEVVLRFAMLQRSSGPNNDSNPVNDLIVASPLQSAAPPILVDNKSLVPSSAAAAPQRDNAVVDESDLDALTRVLGIPSNSTMDDIVSGIWQLKTQAKGSSAYLDDTTNEA